MDPVFVTHYEIRFSSIKGKWNALNECDEIYMD